MFHMDPQSLKSPQMGFLVKEKGFSVISPDEVEKKQRRQRIEWVNAQADKPDSADFFLEYMRVRNTKLAQSPTKLAEVMAKKKADTLSAGERKPSGDDASQREAMENLAESLGISYNDLLAMITASDGDEELTEEEARELEKLFSIADMSAENRRGILVCLAAFQVISAEDLETAGGDADPEGTGDWAEYYAAARDKQRALVQAIDSGAVFTGRLPEADGAREKLRSLEKIADALERGKNRAAA